MTNVVLDGLVHKLEMDGARQESTACGITDLPYDPEWTTKDPASDACPECFPETVKAKPKAKKAK
jgi:hypothetical protein